MKRYLIAFVVAMSFSLFLSTLTIAGEKATPAEVIQKCQEAAEFLSEECAKGPEAEKAALTYMGHKENNRFVWKDTYVWVLCCECEPKTDAAHPIKHQLVGADLSGIKDKQGSLFFLQFCKIANAPQGGWVEYWWPKLGQKKASRKITYILQVPGTKYQVGAGVYDDSISVAQLTKLIQ